MNIIGAGMAGLLAANILRRHEPIIFESSSSLPNNHHALLRFRSDAISRATGIPFRKVSVSKAIYANERLWSRSSIAWDNMYSRKVSGELHGRSISSLETVERYIAPPDFIQRLAAGINIQYGVQWNPLNCPPADSKFCVPTISTIPMPSLMSMVSWKDRPEFNSRHIRVLEFDIDQPICDLYQTIYFPESEIACYRASITGNHVMIELSEDVTDGMRCAENIMEFFGFLRGRYLMNNFSDHVQQYGKIAPVPAEKRQEFVLAMTDKFRVYSLGRFATWRQLLLDDLVGDIELIDRLVSQRNNYTQHIALVKGA